jgi:hypothetical protein
LLGIKERQQAEAQAIMLTRRPPGQSSTGGGNHRGSIFRLLVGAALIRRDGQKFPTWGNGDSAEMAVRDRERALEREVSRVIGAEAVRALRSHRVAKIDLREG